MSRFPGDDALPRAILSFRAATGCAPRSAAQENSTGFPVNIQDVNVDLERFLDFRWFGWLSTGFILVSEPRMVGIRQWTMDR
jgi:hypothetical protein